MINRDKIKVTMSLEDFGTLDNYRRKFQSLIREIKRFVKVPQIVPENTKMIVTIDKQKTQDFLVPLAAEDCELDDYPNGVTVVWEEETGKPITNFDRITKNKANLIHFVMNDVLDLYGPHMNHSIENFRTQKRFLDWLNEEENRNE